MVSITHERRVCPGCEVTRQVYIFSDRTSEFYTGCADCFQLVVQQILPNYSQSVVLRDLLYEARDALSGPTPAPRLTALVEAIDAALE